MTVKEQEYKEQVREFIRTNFLYGNDSLLKDRLSFIENHILDSTGMLELVTHLENTYRIRIDDSEMIADNLDSIENVAYFIARKINGGQERQLGA